jgi:hypothetical protein
MTFTEGCPSGRSQDLMFFGVGELRYDEAQTRSPTTKMGVGELRYDEAQTRSPTTKMIFLILSRNRNISKS